MEQRTQSLEAIGVDTEPTLKRFCGDEDLLVEMLHEFSEEGYEDKLSAALQEQDLHALEHAAHTAKGTSANLGLVELSDKCNEVVQSIRKNEHAGLDAKVQAAVACYRNVCKAVAAIG